MHLRHWKHLFGQFVLATFLSVAGSATLAGSYGMEGWSWRGQDNCGQPARQAVQKMKEGGNTFLRVQLAHGQKGRCPTDTSASHSKRHGKPYSERAELRSDKDFDGNRIYQVRLKVRFMAGFTKDDMTETFLQVKDCPNGAVPVMAKLGVGTGAYRNRAKFGFNLGANDPRGVYKSGFVSASPVDRRWKEFVLYLDTGTPSRAKALLNGRVILPTTAFPNVFKCGSGDLRIGIYRAGSLNPPNPTSVIDYDDVQISQVKAIP